jgi:hypothetical protein
MQFAPFSGFRSSILCNQLLHSDHERPFPPLSLSRPNDTYSHIFFFCARFPPLQERERRDNYVPEFSALTPGDEGIQIDAETKEMLKGMDFGSIGTIASARPAAFNNRR